MVINDGEYNIISILKMDTSRILITFHITFEGKGDKRS